MRSHKSSLVLTIISLTLLFAFLSIRGVRADCSLTTTGAIPLPDLGINPYKGFAGGLYPNSSNTRPVAHEAAGIDIATNQIKPLDSLGNVDLVNGKIVLISVGMSNTHEEFELFSDPGTFIPRANADLAKNPQLVLVNGAIGSRVAGCHPEWNPVPHICWTDPNSDVWTTVDSRLATASATPAQVQVVWMKHAEARPGYYPTSDPIYGSLFHAKVLRDDLVIVAQNLKTKYPNIKIIYLSSRTRAYRSFLVELNQNLLNPEPFAYESSFADKWLVEDYINGTLTGVPYLTWGPYLWADGTDPRSDGFTWQCADVQADFTHPAAPGRAKVADQLLAFFKTDPTATSWFLNKTVVGLAPSCAPTANPSSGLTPLIVNFTANAADPDGTIIEYAWTFDDGTFSLTQNPVKTFPVAGNYNVHLTVSDNSGNTQTCSVPVAVSQAVGLPTPTPVPTAITLNVTASEDSTVNSAKPASNLGTSKIIRVDASPTTQSLLRFNVSGIPVGATIVSAKLKVFAGDASPKAGDVNTVIGGWNETSVTWNTAPAIGTLIASLSDPAVIGAWSEATTTPSITGNGIYDFYLTSTSADSASYNSREAVSNLPTLTIVYF